jgi:putative exosortase-associated protein (TIGR04073 family)
MGGWKFFSAVAAVALLGAALAPAPAAAQTPDAKFRRGLVDVISSPVELPGTIKEESTATNPVQGLTVGLVKGLFRVGQRAAVGVYEVLTFPWGGDSNYGPILEPERAWHRFE